VLAVVRRDGRRPVVKAATTYVRIDTLDQNTENQAIELRRYIEFPG